MDPSPEPPPVVLRFDPARRSYFLGALLRTVRGGGAIEIVTPYRTVEEFPPELRLLIDARAAGRATGTGAGLSWVAGRLLARGVALSRVAGGAALLGISTLTLVVGVLLRVYAFRLRNEDEPGRTLRLIGVPRPPAREPRARR